MKTLVTGYGNVLRGDDGAGPEVAERLRSLGLPDVEIRTAVQPQPEWAAEWAEYERVVLIDAALGGPAVSWERIGCAGGEAGDGGTHHLEPAAVLGLALALYGRAPRVSRWRIRGECFDIGEGLSAVAAAAVEEAVDRIGRMLARQTGAGFRDAQAPERFSSRQCRGPAGAVPYRGGRDALRAC